MVHADNGGGTDGEQIFSSKDDDEEGGKGKKTNQAKELLKRYGGAYLVTSISLSLVSFALCYALVQAGVDVPIVLDKVWIVHSRIAIEIPLNPMHELSV